MCGVVRWCFGVLLRAATGCSCCARLRPSAPLARRPPSGSISQRSPPARRETRSPNAIRPPVRPSCLCAASCIHHNMAHFIKKAAAVKVTWARRPGAHRTAATPLLPPADPSRCICSRNRFLHCMHARVAVCALRSYRRTIHRHRSHCTAAVPAWLLRTSPLRSLPPPLPPHFVPHCSRCFLPGRLLCVPSRTALVAWRPPCRREP